MASVYKILNDNDVTNTRTLLHETVPITGSILTGTYGTFGSERNIKNYSHGMFQSVYDYPYLSSSANHIFDITFGYAASSSLSSSTNFQNSTKINMYSQMAKILMGYNESGSIQVFDKDGDLTGGDKAMEVYFLNLSRLLVKDEIKKGSFQLILGVSSSFTSSMQGELIKVDDATAGGDTGVFKINSPAGEYGILKASNYANTPLDAGTSASDSCGLIFYQAGIVVLTASLLQGRHSRGDVGATATNAGLLSSSAQALFVPGAGLLYGDTGRGSAASVWPAAAVPPDDFLDILTGSSISGASDALRHRIHSLSFNNTTELHSTIYFCRVNHNDFNYSSNPTYISGSRIVVKSTSFDKPISYITTIGLYSADNEVLATAKLSEPIKNTPDNEITFRVRLDY